MNALAITTDGILVYDKTSKKYTNTLTIVTNGLILYGRMNQVVKNLILNFYISDKTYINIVQDN